MFKLKSLVKQRWALVSLTVIFLTALISLIYLIIPGYKLSITVTPEGSQIKVDRLSPAKTKFIRKLSPGKHTVVVSKEDYETEEKIVNLTQDLSLNFSLNPSVQKGSFKTSLLESVGAFSFTTATPISKSVLVAIDNNTSFLVMSAGGKVTNLFSEPVYSFSVSYPNVVLITDDNRERIVIVNLKTRSTKIVQVKDYAPLNYASLSPDSSEIFFLGKYNPAKRVSTLYSTSVENFSPKEITETRASIVESAANNKIIFLETADAPDKGNVTVYDLASLKNLSFFKGNFFLLSPDKNSVLVQGSQGIEIINLNNLSRNFIPIRNLTRLAWEDNSHIIVVNNLNPGVSFYVLDLVSLQKTPQTSILELKDKTIRKVLGFSENSLFVLDGEGETWRVAIQSQ